LSGIAETLSSQSMRCSHQGILTLNIVMASITVIYVSGGPSCTLRSVCSVSDSRTEYGLSASVECPPRDGIESHSQFPQLTTFSARTAQCCSLYRHREPPQHSSSRLPAIDIAASMIDRIVTNLLQTGHKSRPERPSAAEDNWM
jgi:hypothetical protein